jgi:zinc and cadmium transporter
VSITIINILFFIFTFFAGYIAMRIKWLKNNNLNLLLSFSGSFLLSITFLHLIPDTIGSEGHKAGLFLLIGFFLQLIIQKFTHGVEHGHMHHHDHNHRFPLNSILVGLGVHAIMEGFPLGFNLGSSHGDIALYFAVGIHKLPEIMIIGVMLNANYGISIKSILLLILFSSLTPFASYIAGTFGTSYINESTISGIIIPLVAGAFVHIATTIFFESGTKQHHMSWQKILAITFGLALGAMSLLNHSH